MSLEEYYIKEFFKKGFLFSEFKKNDCLVELDRNLNSIYENKIKDNFKLESKYANTQDLRPTAFDYDSSFLDVLIDNEVDKLIDHITQKDMLLAHVQVRCSKAGHSYMPWHRDVYSTSTRDVGMMPPAIKLIYYLPSDEYENKLEILEGTHRIALNGLEETDYILPGFSTFDNQLFKMCKMHILQNRGSNFVIFDTSCAHSVSKTEKDSVRIIYTFSTEYQIMKTFSGGRHLELMEKYRCLKTKQ